MAEAVVEDRPQPQRFYCHLCSVEVPAVNSDFTCPLCSGGFIEELPAPSEQNSEDADMPELNGVDDLDVIRDEIATLLMSRGNYRMQDSDGGEEDGQGSSGFRRVRNRTPRRIRMRNFGRFDNILLEILQTLSGGNDAALGNTPLFFMGNPGDYAWGREGIDTIVTQLLNQMDTTGPPPLSKEKIDEIPNVNITQEQVEHKLQCSICWEDFKLSEQVRKLPCLHVYHENCIVPWLQLHGTCPICRKCLMPDGLDTQENLRRNASDDQGANSGNNDDSVNNTSQDGSEIQDGIDFFNTISLSRLFSQPGPSSQFMSRLISSDPGSQSSHHNQQQHQQSNDVGAAGGGGSSSTRNNNHSDVYKYDDGNVEFEFD